MRTYSYRGIIIIPHQHIKSSICITLRKNQKLSLIPKFSDLHELDDMVNITLGISQVRFINWFPIEFTT